MKIHLPVNQPLNFFLVIVLFFSALPSFAQSVFENKDTIYIASKSKPEPDERIAGKTYINVDIDARGKNNRISTLIDKNVKHPSILEDEKVQGNVVDVSFVVDTDGKVKDAILLNHASPSLDEEALRAVNSLSNLKPAKKNGKPVPVQIIHSVHFAKIRRPHDVLSTTGKWFAEYKGGTNALISYIRQNVKYPPHVAQSKLEGRVVVRFVISPEGKVVSPEVVQSMHFDCDREAVRVVSEMPEWLPTVDKGKYVSCYFALPIAFKLSRNKFKNPASSRTY